MSPIVVLRVFLISLEIKGSSIISLTDELNPSISFLIFVAELNKLKSLLPNKLFEMFLPMMSSISFNSLAALVLTVSLLTGFGPLVMSSANR